MKNLWSVYKFNLILSYPVLFYSYNNQT